MTRALSLEALGPAGVKLRNLLRPDEAEALLNEASQKLGPDLDAPQQRYRFGALLLSKGIPILRVVGRSIMAQAVLHGATPTET